MRTAEGKIHELVARYADACIDPGDTEAVVGVVVQALIEGGYTVRDPQGREVSIWEGR